MNTEAMPPRFVVSKESPILAHRQSQTATRWLRVLWWLCLVWFLVGVVGTGVFLERSDFGHQRRAKKRGFDREKVEALLNAIQTGNEEKVSAMLDMQPLLANAEQDWVNRWTVLHDAVANGRLTITEILLARGAEVNITNKEGETPLHWAAKNGHAEIARLLLQRKADPNANQTRRKNTPLHEAAFLGHGEVAALLLANGANPNAQDIAGKTPLYYAIDNSHAEIAELLRKTGAKE